MINEIQGSDAWINSRLGKVTASRIAHIVAKTKSGYSTSRANYALELALERITNTPYEGFKKNAYMEWGTETEPAARCAYEAHTGMLVGEVGMIPHPTLAMTGASPDGLVGLDGQIEIKCPGSTKHLANLVSKQADEDYMCQMQWQMACTNRSWCDFVSYDPRFPEHLQLVVVRVPRNETFIADLEKEVKAFLAEIEAAVKKLNDLQPKEIK